MIPDLVVPESLHLLLIGCLSHLKDQRGLSKPEVLRGHVAVQEDVDAWNETNVEVVDVLCAEVTCSKGGGFELTFPDAEGHGDHSVGAGDSVQAADEVRQVVQHTQVVLHHNDIPGAGEESQVWMTSVYILHVGTVEFLVWSSCSQQTFTLPYLWLCENQPVLFRAVLLWDW